MGISILLVADPVASVGDIKLFKPPVKAGLPGYQRAGMVGWEITYSSLLSRLACPDTPPDLSGYPVIGPRGIPVV
jgi:hypothetical protein